jgi:hypothetical protein
MVSISSNDATWFGCNAQVSRLEASFGLELVDSF